MPQFTITATGDVKDFWRVDNAYAAFKREADKMLKAWKLVLEVKYSEFSPGGVAEKPT